LAQILLLAAVVWCHLQGKLILWRCVFVTHLLVILVLGSFAWGQSEGLSIARRRAEAFNVLVFGEIGYALTTRFIKASTLHKRALRGNPWCFLSIGITAALQVGGVGSCCRFCSGRDWLVCVCVCVTFSRGCLL
jgi:magnesium-transporting ATPase (P-type)